MAKPDYYTVAAFAKQETLHRIADLVVQEYPGVSFGFGFNNSETPHELRVPRKTTQHAMLQIIGFCNGCLAVMDPDRYKKGGRLVH